MANLPIYNHLAVPDVNIYYKTDYYTLMTGKKPAVDEKVILLILKEDLSREEIDNDSFYPIGLTGNITEVSEDGYLLIHTKKRINIDEVTVFTDYSIDISISRRNDIEDYDESSEEATKRINTVKAMLLEFSSKFEWAQMIRSYASRWKTMGEIGAAMSPWLMNSNEERYAILEMDSKKERFDSIEKMLLENFEFGMVNQEAQNAQEEDYRRIYRESAIKKQMEYLQNELDEMHPENVSDLRKLEMRIEEAGMNESARAEAAKILNRIKHEGETAQNMVCSMIIWIFLRTCPGKKKKQRISTWTALKRFFQANTMGCQR